MDPVQLADRTAEIRQQVPFLDLLQVDSIQVGQGACRIELLARNSHLRNRGLMHGGVVASLLDSVTGTAAGSVAPPEHFAVTIQLNVNFVRPIKQGQYILATGEVVHVGRQTAVARGEIRQDDGALAATASATFMFLPVSGPPTKP